MSEIPEDHPRYDSLITRERIVEGVRIGITSPQGLVAQGRGESFDYLLGECTSESASCAEKVAVAMLLLARRPVISVNGNTAALVPDGLVALSEVTGASLEVNLFHRSETRVGKIIDHLRSHGATDVLGGKGDARIDVNHDRAVVDGAGIYAADVVLVPLEDGDRCQALVHMGKSVIAIDLNPLSRTSRTASVTIVDNVTRAIDNMVELALDMDCTDKDVLRESIVSFDNEDVLSSALELIRERLLYISGGIV
ncbi:MAG: phosphopantothenate/pantothenate synthetase [Methanosarcinaceae archaeon]|nr:phosphopantothenate/pantothenate synthetase [Methanosarcinaceae archaeon]